MSTPEANLQAVLDINKAREAALLSSPRNWDEFRTYFAETFVEYGAWNIQSVDDFIERVIQAWEKLRMEVTCEEILASDNRVVARWTLNGVHQDMAFGYPATGKDLQWESVEIYYFDEAGKVTAMRYFSNIIELLAQLGYEMPADHMQF